MKSNSPESTFQLKPMIVGFAAGVAFFLALHPTMLGYWPRPILEREANISLLFRGFPFVIVPFVIVAVALLQPKTMSQAFKAAFALSESFLVPIPIVNGWVVGPQAWGIPASSFELMMNLGASFLFLSGLALFASFVSSLVSPSIGPFLVSRFRTFFPRRS